MAKRQHSKETIISTLQNLAAALKTETLSKREVSKVLPTSSVDFHFGSLGTALEAAGLKRTLPGCPKNLYKRLSIDELFESLCRVEQALGRVPKCNEYNAHGDYSSKPFRKRFGPWSDTLKHYDAWKKDRGDVVLESAIKTNPERRTSQPMMQRENCQPSISNVNGSFAPPQFYGEPIDFRGLRHAPINEQGVVYLFGMVSRELGFYIEAIQQGFPDCEGKYLYDARKNLWAKARIEFEFRASSFKEHGHDTSGCDVVVCWFNDWPECPVRVIELRREILKLPSR